MNVNDNLISSQIYFSETESIKAHFITLDCCQFILKLCVHFVDIDLSWLVWVCIRTLVCWFLVKNLMQRFTSSFPSMWVSSCHHRYIWKLWCNNSHSNDHSSPTNRGLKNASFSLLMVKPSSSGFLKIHALLFHLFIGISATDTHTSVEETLFIYVRWHRHRNVSKGVKFYFKYMSESCFAQYCREFWMWMHRWMSLKLSGFQALAAWK